MKNYVLIAAITLIAACSALGLTPPQSFDQKLAYATELRSSIVDSAAAATTNGTLSVADAKEIQQISLNAEALLDSAKTLEVSDLTTAQAKLTLADNVITQLQSYLLARGVKK